MHVLMGPYLGPHVGGSDLADEWARAMGKS